ncbi:MAG: transposase family protein [Deltaproteobacteria bacterium]|nr:transposase family protein [Deltaproteobacteria bacterium]
MSGLSIASYFPFLRVKLSQQSVDAEACVAHIHAEPDLRFHPICHVCGQKGSGAHSWMQRTVRDLNFATARVWVNCRYRELFCLTCHCTHIEDLGLFHPYLRVTNRLALYVYHLCRVMTVSEVADHLDLNWKTVKAIDKQNLERDYGTPDYPGLRI